MAQVLVGKRPRGEGGSESNTTIVAEIISCMIARNGRKSRKISVPSQEKNSPAPFAHMDGSLGWNPWTDSRRQRGGQYI